MPTIRKSMDWLLQGENQMSNNVLGISRQSSASSDETVIDSTQLSRIRSTRMRSPEFNAQNLSSHNDLRPTEIIDLENEGYEPFQRTLTPDLEIVSIEPRNRSSPTAGAICSEDFLTEQGFSRWLKQQNSDLTRSLATSFSPFLLNVINIPRRNQPLSPPLFSIEKYEYNGITLRPGITVQLINGEFMRIVLIVRNNSMAEVTLRGWIFRRTHTLHGLLPTKRNEVCWYLSVDKDDERSPKEQGVEERQIREVMRIRTLKLTNRAFPQLSFREEGLSQKYDTKYEYWEAIKNDRVLVCRWQFICFYPNSKARGVSAYTEKALLNLQEEDCDQRCHVKMEALRRDWRSSTVKGGSCFGIEQDELCHLQQEFEKAEAYKGRSTRRSSLFFSPTDISMERDRVHKSNSASRPNKPYNNGQSSSNNSNIRHRHINTNLVRQNEGAGQRTKKRHALDDLDSESNDLSKFLETIMIDPLGTSDTILSNKPRRQVHNFNVVEDLEPTTSKSVGERQRTNGQLCTRSPLLINPHRETELRQSFDYVRSDPRSKRQRLESKDSSLINKYVRASATAFRYRPSRENYTQRYSYADGYCGAGGMTRGAVMAGLCPQWGLDMDEDAIKTWSLNFPYAKPHQLWAHEFATRKTKDPNIDILHLSPPCQFFSPAHTTVGKDDDQNTASLFAITMLLQKTRPRVVTIENTSGLEKRHLEYMRALVHLFTCVEYSVRWKTINLKDFGVPQSRKRLIVIASCPGETLPDFPKPTHSAFPEQTGLKPWTTINDAIEHIPWDWPDHDVSRMRRFQKPPKDGNGQANCLTTNGGGEYHPSGERNYTIREAACLQGFPMEHQFSERRAKKQIGNAVPPIFAKVLLEHVKKSLWKADGIPDPACEGPEVVEL